MYHTIERTTPHVIGVIIDVHADIQMWEAEVKYVVGCTLHQLARHLIRYFVKCTFSFVQKNSIILYGFTSRL